MRAWRRRGLKRRWRRRFGLPALFLAGLAIGTAVGLFAIDEPTIRAARNWIENGPAAFAQNAAATGLAGRASVIDGDTIEIHGTRIRFEGIDAPERRQTCRLDGQAYRCGQKAAFALADKIGAATVACSDRGLDRYGRTLAICYLDGLDLNGWMVEQGWAFAYRRYSMAYVRQEEAARAAGRGLWVGSFEWPWDWRRSH